MAETRSTADTSGEFVHDGGGLKLTAPWTHFYDMHSGGEQKLQWAHIYIEAPEEDAKRLFSEAFGRDPENVTCNCCGEDYRITEEPSLGQATAHGRHLTWCSPLGDEGWRTATLEERRHANQVGRYLEPDEDAPEGWSCHRNLSVEHGNKPVSLDEFLSDPHFESFGRRESVLLLNRHGAFGGPDAR